MFSGDALAIIDGKTNNVTATISLATYTMTYPISVAVNQRTNRVYVGDGSGNVAVISGAINAVIASFPVGSRYGFGDSHYGLDVNPATNRVYVSNVLSSSVSVIDGSNNTVIATGFLGKTFEETPVGVGVDPTTNTIYVANASPATVSVINGTTNTVIATVQVRGVPFGVGVNPRTNLIYVTEVNADSVAVISGPPQPNEDEES